MIKERVKQIKKRIKETYLYKLLNAKNIIKKLEEEKEEIEIERRCLIDKNRILNLQIKRQDKQEKKTAEYKKQINDLNALLEKEKQETAKIINENQQLASDLFQTILDKGKYKIQCEEYAKQIEDLKSDRYLIKKIPSGRTPNTNKTKISKPMPNNVVKFMRDEHE